MNVSCNLKYPHKKHFEVNMQNVPFQQYPSVPAFTQAFGFRVCFNLVSNIQWLLI